MTKLTRISVSILAAVAKFGSAVQADLIKLHCTKLAALASDVVTDAQNEAASLTAAAARLLKTADTVVADANKVAAAATAEAAALTGTPTV
jgi:hypothetical protein